MRQLLLIALFICSIYAHSQNFVPKETTIKERYISLCEMGQGFLLPSIRQKTPQKSMLFY
jgi:hypothetical protein